MIGRLGSEYDPVSLVQYNQLRNATLGVSLGDIPEDLQTANARVPSIDCDDSLLDSPPIVRNLSVEWQRASRGNEHLAIRVHEQSLEKKGIFGIVRSYDLRTTTDGAVIGCTDLRYKYNNSGDGMGDLGCKDLFSDARIALFTEWFQLEPLLSMQPRDLTGGDVPFIKREVESFSIQSLRKGLGS